MNTAAETASLYIHIPFCAACCDYCDFYSEAIGNNPALSARIDDFMETLLADIEYQLDFFNIKKIPTVYIGGGTPSVLGAQRIGFLFAGLGALFTKRGIAAPEEFTVEANPESATEDFLLACLKAGVTRLSLGIQSFHELSRTAINRAGTSRLETALELVSRHFPGNFSADLIAGLPFQTRAILLNDIEKLLSFGPGHISLYSLTVEPKTPLARNLSKGDFALPGDPDALWLAGRDSLLKAGFMQYEVSNFALPGKQCTHNIRYWRMENWLGAGPAASGTIIDEKKIAGKRYTYMADINAYLAAPKPSVQSALVEELDRNALIRESLLMGFRFREGPGREIFKRRFGRDIEEFIPETINRWRKRGFFCGDGTKLAPTGKLILFLDGFLREAFLELDRVKN